MRTFRHIGTRHIHLEATDSTNNRAAEFAHDQTNSGLAISADVQTQGRGQHGRVWLSQPGTNVLLSILLFPPDELRKPAVLTALASVAVAETVLELAGEGPTIKWPNDVLVGGKKIAGILIESGVKQLSTLHSVLSTQYFVIGIGLNVNQSQNDFETYGLPDATSLSRLTDRSFEVAMVTQHLIQKLDEIYGQCDIAELEANWTTRLGLQGNSVTAVFMNGEELDGRLRTMSFEHLEIESTNGVVRWLRPEEVRHIRAKSL